MNSNVQPTAGQVNDPALAFKTVMATAIERALEADPALTKKSIAMDLGVSQSALSHWLSPETQFSIPGHLIPRFCQLVGDDSLIWHLHTIYGGAR